MKAVSLSKAAGKLLSALKSGMHDPRLQKLLPLLALASIALWMLRPCLRPGFYFHYDFDNEYMLGPVFSHASRILQSFHLPLWMNTPAGGIPLYNSPQVCLWYPLFFVFLPIYKTSISIIQSLHHVTLLHIVILEFTSYFLLRALKLSRFSSVMGAVLFAFSANTLVYTKWGNALPAYSWMLLYLGALVLLFRTPSVRIVLLAVFSMVMVVLAGPAQPLILSVYITIVFTGYQFIANRRRLRPFLYSLAGLAAVGAISILLTAPVLGPIFFEYGQMIRYVVDGPPVRGFDNISFEAFLLDQMSFKDFLGITFPLSEKKEVGSQLLGPFILTLALLGLVSGRREPHLYFFAFLGGYSLLSAAGANLGFAYINYRIPLINMIREPSKFLFLFVLAACVLAAIGIDHLRSRASLKDERFFSKREHLALAAILVIWALSYFLGQEHFSSLKRAGRISLVWGASIAYLWAAGWTRAKKPIFYSSIIVFAIAAAYMNARIVRWDAPNISGGRSLRQESLRLHSVFRRLADLDPSHNYRVLIDGKLHKQQAAMIGSLYGVRTFNIYFNPVPELNMRDLYYYEARPHKYFQAMGARYLICDFCSSEATQRYDFREEVEGIKIYETSDAAPYYYLKPGLDATYDGINDYAWKTSDFPLESGILLASEPDVPSLGLTAAPAQNPAGCAFLEEERSPNRFSFAVNCPGPQVFVLNEFNSGQWQARRNGKDTPLFSVNWNQIGVPVPAGPSRIEIEYAPRNLKKAMYPFAAGLLAVFGLIFYSVRDRVVPLGTL